MLTRFRPTYFTTQLLVFCALWLSLPAAFAENRPWGLSLSFGVPHPINLAYEKIYEPNWTGAASLGSLKLKFQNKYTIGVSNIDVRARWHPFDGAFFLGGILGFQTLSGSVIETFMAGATPVPTTIALDITSIFLTPHLGWIWGLRNPGFFFGFEIGGQKPFGAASKLNVTVNDPALVPLTDLVKATAAYQNTENKLETYANAIGLIAFPYATVRLGWIF